MFPKLYKTFYEKRVFSLDEASLHYPTKQQALNAIHYMKKNGYLKRIKAGLYCVVPFEYLEKEYSPDLILIGSRLTKPYFFSHLTALRIYGFVDTHMPKIVVTSPSRFRKFTFEDRIFLNVYTKHFFGYKEHFYKEDLDVYISDQERTFLDCINRFELSGGPVRAFQILSNFGFINYLLLMEYLERIGNKTLMAKVGFILDLLRSKWDVPDDIINDLRNRIHGETIYHFDRGTPERMGELIKKWNLVVSKNYWDLIGMPKLY